MSETKKEKNEGLQEQKLPEVVIEDRNPVNIDIKDVTINVFGDDGCPMECVSNWRVDVIHKPTGITISESSQKGIHRNRRLAMQRLSEELALRMKKD